MKAILISTRPQWVELILNGIKTLEIRNRFSADYVGWVYIYCTLGQGLVFDSEGKGLVNSKLFPYAINCPEHNRLINGKVVARFWCDKVLPTHGEESICDLACITKQEYLDYLGYDGGYAIRITKLEIFDEPKEISEFNVMREYSNCGRCPYALEIGCSSNGWCGTIKPLTRAPESWCYVEV